MYIELREVYLGRSQTLKRERLPHGECVSDKSRQKCGSQEKPEVLNGGV